MSKNTKRFVTRDAQAGNVIDEFDSIAEAKFEIELYYASDIAEFGNDDFRYEVYDTVTEEIVY